MNKSELIDQISAEAGISKKDAGAVVDAMVQAIRQSLASGDTVTLPGFGSFSVTERAPRVGRNPQTGKEIKIAGGKYPRFRPGKGLKDAVSPPPPPPTPAPAPAKASKKK